MIKSFAALKRERPEALDDPDLPDMTPTKDSQRHLDAMEAKAPGYMQDLLADRLKTA